MCLMRSSRFSFLSRINCKSGYSPTSSFSTIWIRSFSINHAGLCRSKTIASKASWLRLSFLSSLRPRVTDSSATPPLFFPIVLSRARSKLTRVFFFEPRLDLMIFSVVVSTTFSNFSRSIASDWIKSI